MIRLFALLPWACVRGLALATAFLLGDVLRYRRTLVTKNLRQSFPDKSPADIRALRRKFYLNLADLAMETIKSLGMDEAELRERVKLTNPEILLGYIANEQPVMIVGSHQANWEWVFLACSMMLPIPLEGIYRPLHNKWVDRLMARVRTRFGARLIADSDALKDIVSHLKTPRAISFVADQHPPRKGPRFWTHFLGQDTAFYTGWAKLAQVTRYPVFFAHRQRTARGYYEVTLEPLGAPPYPNETNLLVERYARAVERSIQQQPDAWLWSHRRWRDEKPLYT